MEKYGVLNVWQQGDLVTRCIFLALLTMSITSWIVLLSKAILNRRLAALSKLAQVDFWAAQNLDEGIEALGRVGDNPFRVLALAGREANEQEAASHSLMQGRLGSGEWVARGLRNAFDEEVAHLQNGLAVLGSIGSTAPFVGLFGTVWGIYHALVAIAASGEASLGHVAGPVGESLIMTAFGLFVAIPAVLGFNYANRGNTRVRQHLHRFMYELHVYLVMGEKARDEVRRPALSAGLTKSQNVYVVTDQG